MMTRACANDDDENSVEDLRIILDNGFAESMGDGLFILFVKEDGEDQSIVLSTDDLKAMLSAA